MSKKTQLEIQAEQQRQLLLAKNEYNENITEGNNPGDPNDIGETGTLLDKQQRLMNLKGNKYGVNNQYPDFE